MNKLERIEQKAQKARERIAAMQALLRQIDGERTEQENLQIVQQIRALKLTREELYAFLGGGELPASLVGMMGGTPAADAEPETITSRRGRSRRHEPDTPAAPESETPEEHSNFESEETRHEE